MQEGKGQEKMLQKVKTEIDGIGILRHRKGME